MEITLNGLKRLGSWKKLFRRECVSLSRTRPEPSAFFITTLEERCVLNGSFDGTGGTIVLDGFDVGVDIAIDQNGSDYDFVLSSGTWTGTDIGSDVVASGATLSVRNDFATTILIDDTDGNDPNIEFDRVNFNDLDATDSLTLVGVGEVTQTPDDGSGTDERIQVEELIINGATLVALANPENDFDVVSVTATGDVDLTDRNEIEIGTTAISNSGKLTVTADGHITQTSGESASVAGSTTLTTTSSGNITFDGSANNLSGQLVLNSDGDATIHNEVDKQIGSSTVNIKS